MNRGAYIKRELLSRVISMIYRDSLSAEIDTLAIELFPKRKQSYRCCVYKDRAMIRNRLLAILGFSSKEEDESKPLSYFAELAEKREKPAKNTLSLFPDLCSQCSGGDYYVTEMCRRCFSRSCMEACPRNAIEVQNDKAVISKESCIGCGKCLEACPYHAIVYRSVPCEDSCPVDAIKVDEEGDRYIDHSLCIACGKCVTRCPFGAALDISHIVDVFSAIRKGRNVRALVAPSILAQFPDDPRRLFGALAEAGFSGVCQVAQGAEEVSREEAAEVAHRKEEEGSGPLYTSCCPGWKSLVEKHIPALKDSLSQTGSPMKVTAQSSYENDPNTLNVFIGPCFAKKNEAASIDEIFAVLSFEEMGALLLALDIQLETAPVVNPIRLENLPDAGEKGQLFARAGGVADSLLPHLSEPPKLKNVEGIDSKTVKGFKVADKIYGGFDIVEVMACEGGCLNGPGVINRGKSCGVLLEKRAVELSEKSSVKN